MGVIAGGLVGSPVRRSKREPCSQHSMALSSTSPSDKETFAWLQVSSIAWMSPALSRTTATALPSTSTWTAPTFGRSSTEQTRTYPSVTSAVTAVVSVIPTPGRSTGSCLLYTSDAADDLLCVDLGGRRIIKKKKKNKIQNNTQ